MPSVRLLFRLPWHRRTPRLLSQNPPFLVMGLLQYEQVEVLVEVMRATLQGRNTVTNLGAKLSAL